MDTNRTIVGDVGGTNCRLASCDPLTGLVKDFEVFPSEGLSFTWGGHSSV